MGRQRISLLYSLYCIMGVIFHVILVVTAPLLRLLAPDWDIASRLGRVVAHGPDRRRLIWIHAASIGEVQAARVLIYGLTQQQCGCRFYVTTMTRQGMEVAVSQLPEEVCCELAPLDTPQAVAKTLQSLQPDMYICLETELWPVMLTKTRQAGIPMLLLNGRLSERSCNRYRRIARTMATLLNGFAAIGVISRQDGRRYQMIGVPERRIRICGNLKYDLQVPDVSGIEEKYREILNLSSERVFICGSTRSGEEKLLLPVYRRLQQETTATGVLWIIAPRHLNRLDEVRGLLDDSDLKYDLLSSCSDQGRQQNIVLVDSMGELVNLYSVGDFIFCGGSLVDKGGHNIMEPIHLQRPVYFGPYMKDFQDAVELVVSTGAGFQVEGADDLAGKLTAHIRDPQKLQQACRAAAELAEFQQGAVQRQADMVMDLLAA